MSVQSFPLATPALSPNTWIEADFAVQRRQSAGLVGSGRDFVIDRGVPQWKATVKSRMLFDTEIGQFRAFRDALRGGARFFTMWDPLREYPSAYMPAGPPAMTRATIGGSFDGHCSLFGNSSSLAPGVIGSDLLGIGPPYALPVGLTLQSGDYIELREGANLAADVGGWTPSNATLTANSAVAPDGTTTAATLTRTTGGVADNSSDVSSVVAGQGQFYRVAIWLKAGTFSGAVTLAVRDGVGAVNQFTLAVTPTTTWQRFEFTGQMSPSAANGMNVYVFVASGSAGDTLFLWKSRVTAIVTEKISLHRVLDQSTVADSTGFLIAWVEPELPTSFDHDAIANVYRPRGKFRLIDFQLPVLASGRARPGQVTMTAMSTLL